MKKVYVEKYNRTVRNAVDTIDEVGTYSNKKIL